MSKANNKRQIQLLQEVLAKCEAEITQLKRTFEETREAKAGKSLLAEAKEVRGLPAANHRIMKRKDLRGHHGKVYAIQWCKGQQHDEKLVSASQDGKLIVWNCITTNKTKVVPLASAWVMTVAYSDSGEFVACGGLDNTCSIYQLSKIGVIAADEKQMVPRAFELTAQSSKDNQGHDGYVSSCRFLSDQQMLTASGDQTCMLWSIQEQKVISTFRGHTSDVNSVAPFGRASTFGADNVFISGSCDHTAKVWDIRTGKCVQTHVAHDGDVNSVALFPDGQAFGTASDDATCKVFDLRSWQPIVSLHDAKVSSATSCAFSGSGRLLFAGYDDNTVRVWDVLKSALVEPALAEHEKRVSCLDVNKSGQALATGSWDEHIKIWA